MVLPHKLINPEEYCEEIVFSDANLHIKHFLKNVLPKFSDKFLEKSFEEYFIGSVEVLSRYKCYRNRRKHKNHIYDLNYEYETFLGKVLSFYKDHALYNHVALEYYNAALNAKIGSHYAYAEDFYTKIKSNSTIESKEFKIEQIEGSKTHRRNKELSKEVKRIHSQHTNNKILLFDTEKIEPLESHDRSHFVHKCLKEYSLILKGGIPFLPFKHSQYIVDYTNNKLFYFNVMHDGKIKHFEFTIDPRKTELEGEQEGLSKHLWDEPLTDIGLCIGSNKIFVVYGRYVENGVAKNSDRIYFYDIAGRAWYEPQVKALGERTTKRHSVTCCLLQDIKTKIDFLYVFGGECESSGDNKLNISNIVECYKITYSPDLFNSEFEHMLIKKDDLYFERVSYIPYVYSYAFQLTNTNNVFIFGGGKYSQSAYDARLTKYFCYNHIYQRFVASAIDINEDRRALSLKRDPEESLVAADPSRNMLQHQNSVYILARNGDEDYCISQIVATDKPRVCSISHKVPKTLLVQTANGTVQNQWLLPTGEHDRFTMNNVVLFPPNFINLLRQEIPETLLLLSMFAGCIESLFKKDQSLREELLMQMWVAVFKDEMFNGENYPGLGIAAACVFDIAGLFLKNPRIVNLVENMEQNIKLASPQISRRLPIFREIVQKQLFQNFSRKNFIELLNSEVGEAISFGSFSKEIVLKLDRAFQRALRPYDYYIPMYDEGYHRWFTYELAELINSSERELMYLARKEDMGIIRDLVSCLGKLWILNKAEHSAGMTVSIEDLIKGGEQLWRDTELDRFMSNANYSSQGLLIHLDLFVGDQQEHNLLKACQVFLVELAFREKISVETISSTELVEERLEKWKQISVYPELTAYITEKLRQGYHAHRLKTESTNEEKMEFEPQLPKSTAEISIKREQSMLEESKVPSNMSEINLLKSEQKDVEKSTKNEKDMELEDDSIGNKTAESKSGGTVEKGTGGRRGNKYQNKDKETSLMLPIIEEVAINPRVKEAVAYHSIDNLRECHSSDALKSFKFYIPPGGNEIHAVSEDKVIKAVLAIQEPNSKQIDLIYLNDNLHSSLHSWNSAFFLYFDRNLADCYSTIGKQLRDCILYADLRESFTESGRTKGMIVLSPILKNDDGLVNRALIADDQGIFLLGGSRVTTAKKNPITYSNLCSYYHLEDLNNVSNKSVKGDMKPMHFKRDGLIVTQNATYLFVASRDNWNPDKSSFGEKNVIEVYDKDEMEWLTTLEVPYDPSTLNYSLLRAIDEKEVVLFVANRPGKISAGFMIDIGSIAKPLEDDEKKESLVKKVSKFADSSGGFLIPSGFEVLPLQNNYESSKTLLIRSYKKEIPENEEFNPVE